MRLGSRVSGLVVTVDLCAYCFLSLFVFLSALFHLDGAQFSFSFFVFHSFNALFFSLRSSLHTSYSHSYTLRVNI